MAKIPVTLRIEEEVVKRAKHEAIDRGTNLQELVELSIRKELKLK